MKELYKIIFEPAFMDMHLGWFKEPLLKDCMQLEADLETFRLKYGFKLTIAVEKPEPIEGRFYGRGIVEELTRLSAKHQEHLDSLTK